MPAGGSANVVIWSITELGDAPVEWQLRLSRGKYPTVGRRLDLCQTRKSFERSLYVDFSKSYRFKSS